LHLKIHLNGIVFFRKFNEHSLYIFIVYKNTVIAVMISWYCVESTDITCNL